MATKKALGVCHCTIFAWLVVSNKDELSWTVTIRNKSVPIQWAQCWFPGLAIPNAK